MSVVKKLKVVVYVLKMLSTLLLSRPFGSKQITLHIPFAHNFLSLTGKTTLFGMRVTCECSSGDGVDFRMACCVI